MPPVELNDGENILPAHSISSNNLETIQNENTTTEEAEEEKKEEDGWVDVLGSGQLKMKVIKPGQPDTRPQPPDICYIKLKGVLDDGTVVEEHECFQMQLGCHEVIQGIELVVPLMNVEEEVIVVVAPRFGYGSIGNPVTIPPNANLTYNITLLKSEPEPDLESIPLEKRKEMANSKKERGNWWYFRQDCTKAIQCYRKAINLLNETEPYFDEENKNNEYSDEEMKEIIEQKIVIYNNLAAAQLMIEAYESALKSVDRVILWDPKNVKALFRKGKILKARGQINEAVDALREAFSLEPENSAIKMELNYCLKVQQKEKEHEKNLYKKMLGQDKKDDKPFLVSKRKSGSWTKVLGLAATATVMAGVAIAVGYRFKYYSFL